MYKSEVHADNGTYAKVVADSMANSIRLPTLEVKAPKFLDAEFEKHRVFSSNSSSDRAIPFKRLADAEFFLPDDVRLDQPGMQGYELLSDDELALFHDDLIALRGHTVEILSRWNKVHKQHINRYLMGFTWQRKVITGTEWDNLFHLRMHPTADPAINKMVTCMYDALQQSTPTELKVGEYHLPYVDVGCIKNNWVYTKKGDMIGLIDAIKFSTAQCAKASFDNHDGTEATLEENIDLYNMLAVRPYEGRRGSFDKDEPVHLSPTEHQATPMGAVTPDAIDVRKATQWTRDWEDGVTHMDKSGHFWSGNFKGWVQHRQLLGE